jgi:hypothetical protein
MLVYCSGANNYSVMLFVIMFYIFMMRIIKPSVIIGQVSSNKSSLLLKSIFQNTQTLQLQLFTKIIKMESIYNIN